LTWRRKSEKERLTIVYKISLIDGGKRKGGVAKKSIPKLHKFRIWIQALFFLGSRVKIKAFLQNQGHGYLNFRSILETKEIERKKRQKNRKIKFGVPKL